MLWAFLLPCCYLWLTSKTRSPSISHHKPGPFAHITTYSTSLLPDFIGSGQENGQTCNAVIMRGQRKSVGMFFHTCPQTGLLFKGRTVSGTCEDQPPWHSPQTKQNRLLLVKLLVGDCPARGSIWFHRASYHWFWKCWGVSNVDVDRQGEGGHMWFWQKQSGQGWFHLFFVCQGEKCSCYTGTYIGKQTGLVNTFSTRVTKRGIEHVLIWSAVKCDTHLGCWQHLCGRGASCTREQDIL